MADKTPRATAKGRFTRAENVLKKDLAAAADDIPIITIERHQKDLIEKWEKVQDSHDEYVLALVDPTDEDLAREESWLDELATRFSDIEIQVDKLVEQKRKAVISTAEPVVVETGDVGENGAAETVVVTEVVEEAVGVTETANMAAAPATLV